MSMISSPDILPADLKVFLNHVYEYKKGVRRMVLYTVNRKYEAFATARLRSQHIDFLVQPASDTSINLFFGRPECIRAIRFLADRPLNLLSPEEDFILGAMTSVRSANVTVNERKPPANKEGVISLVLFPYILNNTLQLIILTSTPYMEVTCIRIE